MDDKYSLWTNGIPQKDYVNQLFDREMCIRDRPEAVYGMKNTMIMTAPSALSRLRWSWKRRERHCGTVMASRLAE